MRMRTISSSLESPLLRATQTLRKLWIPFLKVRSLPLLLSLPCVEISNVQTDLVERGIKKVDALKISEEEVMLNNHRCCY